MNEKRYKTAMKNIKTSADFNENTIELLSSGEIRKEKYKKRNSHKYLYSALAVCLLLVFFIPSMLNNTKIELQNSTGNVRVQYVDRIPNTFTENDLVLLSEDEIFNKYNTSIFKGEVVDIKNIKIKMGKGSEYYRGVATIKILSSYRGDETTGDTINILLPSPINMNIWVEDTETVSAMSVGATGIFMPMKYDETHILRENDATLYLKDISGYGLYDGERFAFIQTEDKVVYADWAFDNLSEARSLEDIEKYILDRIE